jgi:hypothetical protein
MQATLVRFGPELHAELKAEAARAGISVAQYVREAVVARIAYSAGRRGDPLYGEAVAAAQRMRSLAAATRDESTAVRAEARQAVRRSRSFEADGG